MIKKGKNFQINKYKKFSVHYGTVDFTTNESMYIDISSWLQPIHELDVDKTVKRLNKSIKKTIYNNAAGGVDRNSFIVDLNFRNSGVRLNKKSFMNISITLFSDNSGDGLNHDNIKVLIDVITKSIYSDFSDIFLFNKKKNK
jgi:hypothetical protein